LLLSDRRARLRKIVTIVVGGASALAAFVLVKAMLTRHAQAAPMSASLNSFGPVVASIEMNPKPAAGALGETAETPPVAAAAAAEPAEVPEVRIEVFDEPAEQAPAPKASGPAAPAPASAPRANTKMDARRFLAAGKLKEAVGAARAALAAEPTDAETYLLLGAALQDTGHWEESMIVFASCVQNAKRGPLGDCRALSRR
jgi:Flp pilus assembly protein TadD